MDLLAVWLGKLVVLLLRATGRRATALPGLVIEKLFPGFLPRRLAALAQGVVVVSGTNGKTTTTKMVATVLGRRYRVLTNDTGGNFVRGTITAVLEDASWLGRTSAEVAVFELDEAHSVRFSEVYAPDRLLLLNVLRDQLDRFGEIDTTAEFLGRTARRTTGHVVVNRDDPRLVAVADDTEAEVSYFGVAPSLREMFPTDEELYGGPLSTSDRTASAEVSSLSMVAGTHVVLDLEGTRVSVVLRAEGAHNAQNAAAAAAMALTFGLSAEEIAAGLRLVEPAFGRGQSFDIDSRRVSLQLVKNPAGFRHSLRSVEALSPDSVVIAINDDYPDGRDMSWLWDVGFAEPLSGRAGYLVTSGVRAADMAVRLRYDEVDVDRVEPDLLAAVRLGVSSATPRGTVVVFATYTAMWELADSLPRIAAPAARAGELAGGR